MRQRCWMICANDHVFGWHITLHHTIYIIKGEKRWKELQTSSDGQVHAKRCQMAKCFSSSTVSFPSLVQNILLDVISNEIVILSKYFCRLLIVLLNLKLRYLNIVIVIDTHRKTRWKSNRYYGSCFISRVFH